MKNALLISIVFFFVCLTSRVKAQTAIVNDSTYVFEMMDGNSYIGKVTVLEENKVYQVQTSLGLLTIRQEDVKSVKKFSPTDLNNGQYWLPSPHSTRYFFSPSGYGLRKGEAYYQNAWILFNQVSYGFSDYFTAGVGMIPTFLFGVRDFVPVWITPKINIPYKNGRGAFGAGSLLLGILGESDEAVGIVYGSNTFGTRDKQFTIGLGWGYSTEGGFANSPTVNASGLIRTGKSWSILTENYLIITDDVTAGIISGGARYMGKRFAIDFGGVLPIVSELDGIYVIPWLSISIPFGKKY